MGLEEDASDDTELVLPGKRLSGSAKAANFKKERRKRMKGLPTFASASDYAKMLDDDEGEDLG